MDKEEIEHLRMIWVTALVCTTVFLEVHDELKVSQQYNGKLKASGKQFEIQLFKSCARQVNDLWQTDELAASDLTQAIREIGEHIATLKPSEVMTLAHSLKKSKK